MYWDILQQLKYVNSLVLILLPRVALDVHICSSLVALMALSFSPPLMKSVCFCSTGFNPFLL